MIKQVIFRSVFLLSIQLFAWASFAQIYEIKNMRDIVAEVKPGTLVIWDLDNTLYRPTGYLGSHEHFDFLLRIYELNGLNATEALKEADRVWNLSQSEIQVQPVEKDTPAIVKQQQAKKIRTMALTARSTAVMQTTQKQINSIGVDFSNHSVANEKAVLSRDTFGLPEDAIFERGVLFVGDTNDKGIVLEKFLKVVGYTPKKIVFVDDREKNVKDMDAVLKRLKIPYACFRYGAADEKVSFFNKIIAELKDKQTADLFLLGKAPKVAEAN